MKKISIVFLLILSLFLTSCNNDIQSSNEATEENDLNERIEALESEIKNLEESLEEISKDMVVNKDETTASHSNNFIKTNTLFHLVENLSDVDIKEGYILDYVSEDDDKHFIIDYADMIDDSNEPNGFRIDNQAVENEKVMITENLELYIGEYASDPKFPTKIELDSDEMDLEDMKQGFYRFYSIEDELILVLRIYIP